MDIRELNRPMLKVSQYFDTRLVAHLDSTNREEALRSLVDILELYGYLKDKDAFYQAVLDREKLVSTGIGVGVAIPHAKLASYDEFFVAIGILKNGVDWDAHDGAPVRLIFLIGGPDDKQTQYLQILSRLTFALKDENRRKKMLQFHAPEDIILLFENI